MSTSIQALPDRIRAAIPRDLSSRGVASMEFIVGLMMMTWGVSGLGITGSGPLHRSLAASGLMLPWGLLLCTIGCAMSIAAAADALFGRQWPERAVMRSAWLRFWVSTAAMITWVWVANSLLKTGMVIGAGALYWQLPVFMFAHAWSAGLNILVKVVADDRIATAPEYRLKR